MFRKKEKDDPTDAHSSTVFLSIVTERKSDLLLICTKFSFLVLVDDAFELSGLARY